jgi:hypothetical protein
MLTPDQVRLRLTQAFEATRRTAYDKDSSDGVYRATHMLIDLLQHVLPDLVAPVRQPERTTQSHPCGCPCTCDEPWEQR